MGNRTGKIDFVAELRLRQWARRNYVPPSQRCDSDWHSVVLDEMRLIDQDHSATQLTTGIVASTRRADPESRQHDGRRTDEPHAGIPSPRLGHSDPADASVETPAGHA